MCVCVCVCVCVCAFVCLFDSLSVCVFACAVICDDEPQQSDKLCVERCVSGVILSLPGEVPCVCMDVYVCVCVCVEGLGLPHLPQFLLSCPLLFDTETHRSKSETIKPTLALETPHPTTNQTNPPSRFPKHPRMQADEQESTGASRRCRDHTGQGAHNKSLCTLHTTHP